jgi:hypothetical protein
MLAAISISFPLPLRLLNRLINRVGLDDLCQFFWIDWDTDTHVIETHSCWVFDEALCRFRRHRELTSLSASFTLQRFPIAEDPWSLLPSLRLGDFTEHIASAQRIWRGWALPCIPGWPPVVYSLSDPLHQHVWSVRSSTRGVWPAQASTKREWLYVWPTHLTCVHLMRTEIVWIRRANWLRWLVDLKPVAQVKALEDMK